MKHILRNLKDILINGAMVYVLAMARGDAQAQQESPPAGQNPITAIDIALEPDATMIEHAEAVNSRLLKVFPKGFALGTEHKPHISMLQRYVRTTDLDKVYAAVGE